MKGAIICGYPGVGKSTLANSENGYIDLESGNFWVSGKRDEHWCDVYCNIALHLAWQGYKVFLSCHESVIKQLAKLPTDNYAVKILCFPDTELESKWINKLIMRFGNTMLDKDFKAMANACGHYVDNINKLKKQKGFKKVVLTNMDYDLEEVLRQALSEGDS